MTYRRVCEQCDKVFVGETFRSATDKLLQHLRIKHRYELDDLIGSI